MIWIVTFLMVWMAWVIVSQLAAMVRAKRELIEMEARVLDYEFEIFAAIMRDTDRRLKKKLTIVKKESE